MFNTLSGRFLVLTIVFVMLAEIFIFIPSISRFRVEFLSARIERAQIASLALLADEMLSTELEEELLENAAVFNVVLRRNATRELVLTSELPQPVHDTFDLRSATTWDLIRDALSRLADPRIRVIRVIGEPRLMGGSLIEVTLQTQDLRNAMINYGLRIFILSAVISAFTALLLFLAVRIVMVRPINRVIQHMKSYALSPEDARQIIKPNAKISELKEAEVALQTMQNQLTGALKQKHRLAQLGEAVSKLSHDLRNILSTVQLLSDRMESSQDPLVKSLAPKLITSVSRAVTLTESTLHFGKAQEPSPQIRQVELYQIVEDVIVNERMWVAGKNTIISSSVPRNMIVSADPDQLHRALSNLVRNARQAIDLQGTEGTINVSASQDAEMWRIDVVDTGLGLPKEARSHLFEPFRGSVRRGGIGLGLSISQELIRGHGGEINLLWSNAKGTKFQIKLPK